MKATGEYYAAKPHKIQSPDALLFAQLGVKIIEPSEVINNKQKLHYAINHIAWLMLC